MSDPRWQNIHDALAERDGPTEADALDGAALRRLREAAINGSPYGDHSPAIRIYYGDGRTFIDDEGIKQTYDAVTVEAWTFPFDVVESGATIAEAADKCREALG